MRAAQYTYDEGGPLGVCRFDAWSSSSPALPSPASETLVSARKRRAVRCSSAAVGRRGDSAPTGSRMKASATDGGAFGQQLWRSVKWAGRALDFGAGQERGARSDEASAVEKALERTVSEKAERVAAEDDEAGEEVAADGSGTYEGYAP